MTGCPHCGSGPIVKLNSGWHCNGCGADITRNESTGEFVKLKAVKFKAGHEPTHFPNRYQMLDGWKEQIKPGKKKTG